MAQNLYGWIDYRTSLSELGIRPVDFNEKVEIGWNSEQGRASPRVPGTLYAWLNDHGKRLPNQSFEKFFAGEASIGTYPTVEAAKTGFKDAHRQEVKNWFLSEMRTFLRNKHLTIDAFIMGGWQTAENEVSRGELDSRGLMALAADNSVTVEKFLHQLNEACFPRDKVEDLKYLKPIDSFSGAAEDAIAIGEREAKLQENLAIGKDYENLVGVKMSHEFIKTYVEDKGKAKLLIRLLDNSISFRGVDQDGVKQSGGVLSEYQLAVAKADEDIKTWTDAENRALEKGQNTVGYDKAKPQAILNLLAVPAIRGGRGRKKDWFGLTSLDAAPNPLTPNQGKYNPLWVNLRAYLRKFCKDNMFREASSLERKVEDIKESYAGGARIKEDIAKEQAKDTLAQLIEDNREKSRFMEQCFLIHNIADLSKISRQHSDRFKFLKMIDGDSDAVLSRLNKRAGFEEMMNITQDKIALLQPTIELYKRTYKGDEKTPEDKQFVFDSHTTKNQINTILSHKGGRAGGVGIQSLTVEFQGTDMESAKRILTVKLRLFVQSMEYFFRLEDDTRASYLDLLAPSKAFKPGNAKTDKWLKDMYTGVEYHASQLYDPVHFEIKAVLGWSVPRTSREFMGKKLLNAVKHNKLVTLLTLNDHTFQFNQDGTMIVDIQYHGRIEGLLDDDKRTSLFETPEVREQRKKVTEEFEKARSQISEKIDTSAASQEREFLKKKYKLIHNAELDSLSSEQINTFRDNLSESGDQDIKDFRRGQKKILDSLIEREQSKVEEAKSKVIKLKHDSYMALMKLLETRTWRGESRVGGLSYIQVNKEQMDFHTKTHGGSFGKFGDSLGSTKKVVAPPSPNPMEDGKLKSTTLTSAVTKARAEQERAQVQSKKPQKDIKQETQQSTSAPTLIGNNYEFGYFFLGDLIDAALEMLDKNGLNTKNNLFDVITGPLVFGTENAKINLNIADIPVSVSEFQHWYTENVVKKDKTNWTFSQFLRAIATKIIFPALGGKCYESAAPMVSRDGNKLGMSVLTYESSPFEGKTRMNIKGLSRSLKDVSSKLEAKTNPGTYEAIFLHADFIPATSKKGNLKEDIGAGIYHLILGRDRGLVKEINFSKENLPFYKEDRMHLDGKIERISHPYIADIKMVGNTYFLPGSRIFVNPALTTGGPANSRNSIVSKLGVGGYYIILGVVLKIEGHTFETQLRTKNEANGFMTSPSTPQPARLGQITLASSPSETPDEDTELGEAASFMPPTVRQATEEEKAATFRMTVRKKHKEEWQTKEREVTGRLAPYSTWLARYDAYHAITTHAASKSNKKAHNDLASSYVGGRGQAQIVTGSDGEIIVFYDRGDGYVDSFVKTQEE